MQNFEDNFKKRINNLLTSDEVGGKNGGDSLGQIYDDLDTYYKPSAHHKIFQNYRIVFKILYSITKENIGSDDVHAFLKDGFTKEPYGLTADDVESCIEYINANPNYEAFTYMDYVKSRYDKLMAELCEYSIYSDELEDLCNTLRSISNSYFENGEAASKLHNNFENAIKSININENPSLGQKILGIICRLYALIFSSGSKEQLQRRIDAVFLSDSEIKEKISTPFVRFFKIPSPAAGDNVLARVISSENFL